MCIPACFLEKLTKDEVVATTALRKMGATNFKSDLKNPDNKTEWKSFRDKHAFELEEVCAELKIDCKILHAMIV